MSESREVKFWRLQESELQTQWNFTWGKLGGSFSQTHVNTPSFPPWKERNSSSNQSLNIHIESQPWTRRYRNDSLTAKEIFEKRSVMGLMSIKNGIYSTDESMKQESTRIGWVKRLHLPGVQGPNQPSLLSNNILRQELSSHLEASLLQILNRTTEDNSIHLRKRNTYHIQTYKQYKFSRFLKK